MRPIEEWPVCVHEAFPAYLSWEQFQSNQQVLRANWYRSSSRGAPRKGAALLQGIAFCGHCGRKMGLQHDATRDKRAPAYVYYALLTRFCVFGYNKLILLRIKMAIAP